MNLIESESAFTIYLEDLQDEAVQKIGRELTSDEIDFAKKGLKWGILSSIDDIYHSIFQDIKNEEI
jgi:hypothetical protein